MDVLQQKMETQEKLLTFYHKDLFYFCSLLKNNLIQRETKYGYNIISDQK